MNSSVDYTNPVSQLIRARYSCRTYVHKPIDPELRQRLTAFASTLNTGPLGGEARFKLVAAGEKDWSALKGLGTYGFIRGVTAYMVGATAEDQHDLEDFGYLLERIILFATDLGLGTCWLGGTFTKTSFAKKIQVQPGELVPSVAAVGYAAKKPRRFDKIIRRGAGADRRKPWEALFFEEGFDAPLAPQSSGQYAKALESVRLGPSASNRQPWRVVRIGNLYHFFLRRSPGYQERPLVRLSTVADLQRIDMGIAMCHFDLTAKELGLSGKWVVSKPTLDAPDELYEYSSTWIGA